jgi:hypothetical protein
MVFILHGLDGRGKTTNIDVFSQLSMEGCKYSMISILGRYRINSKNNKVGDIHTKRYDRRKEIIPY